MTVFTNLTNGDSVLVWQTTDAVNFQLIHSYGVPIGDSVTVENGPSVWASAAPLANGGFSVVWDSSANAQPLAQDYDASGAAVGGVYTLSGAPPIAPIATTSLDLPVAQDPDSGPWTTLLPNGDTVTVTGQDFNGPGAPQLLFQQFDPAGNQVGPDYTGTYQGLPGLGHIETSALDNGDYVVTFTDNQNYGGQLFYELFGADGTHLASKIVASAGFQLIPGHATAALPDGGFVMSWIAAEYNSQDLSKPAPFAVFAQEFDAHGTAVTSQKMLAVLPSDNQFTGPEVVDFGSGVPTFSWTADGAPQWTSFSEHGTLLSHSNDTIFTPAAAYTLPNGPHNVMLVGSAAQTITGNDLGDTLTSNDTASTLIGGNGGDTLVGGHSANIMTGGDGADVFAFPVLPWNAGHITDFNTATDQLDLGGIFASVGYTGSDPVADGYLAFTSDGHGGTQVIVDPQGPNTTTPITVTTLDSVSPSSITPADYGYHSSSGGGGTTTGETLTANDTAGQQLNGGTGDDTFYAGHNSVVMTGNDGADTFVFQYLPWNAGHITDFAVGTDHLDLGALFSASGYTGTNPVADGYLQFVSDGSGGTKVLYDSDGPGTANPWPTTLTTLDHVSPNGLTAADVLGTASSGGGGDDGGGGTTGETLTADDSANQQLTGGAGDDTFYAGHNSVIMTGNDGADNFIFNDLPWNAGHITDFTPGTDMMDFSALFTAAGYTGTNPVADGYLNFASDGSGNTKVYFDADGSSGNDWPTLVTTLDHIQPSQIQASDWIFHH